MGKRNFGFRWIASVLFCVALEGASGALPRSFDQLSCVEILQLGKVFETFSDALLAEIRRIRQQPHSVEVLEIALFRRLSVSPSFQNSPPEDVMRIAEHFADPNHREFSAAEIAIHAYLEQLNTMLERYERFPGEALRRRVFELRADLYASWQTRVWQLASELEDDPYLDSQRLTYVQRYDLAVRLLNPGLELPNLENEVAAFLEQLPPAPPLRIDPDLFSVATLSQWELARRGYLTEEAKTYLFKLISSDTKIQALRVSRFDLNRLVAALLSPVNSAKPVSQVLKEFVPVRGN